MALPPEFQIATNNLPLTFGDTTQKDDSRKQKWEKTTHGHFGAERNIDQPPRSAIMRTRTRPNVSQLRSGLCAQVHLRRRVAGDSLAQTVTPPFLRGGSHIQTKPPIPTKSTRLANQVFMTNVHHLLWDLRCTRGVSMVPCHTRLWGSNCAQNPIQIGPRKVETCEDGRSDPRKMTVGTSSSASGPAEKFAKQNFSCRIPLGFDKGPQPRGSLSTYMGLF